MTGIPPLAYFAPGILFEVGSGNACINFLVTGIFGVVKLFSAACFSVHL